ncbi:amidohydrolase [Candidatus Nanohalococcus occultus]|uniref:Cytosine deaminase or related metal-dependent hydrolase n=1 Tax=Candidatus Nanohalococcus occultus TaxID=2978047 RepID=A0ABY8CHT3_9ARCH|nr:Cytosine deaminase or related metal-dependent hydrolase [Candidatus Nanohaloarchaeota archaeon SVXNc]
MILENIRFLVTQNENREILEDIDLRIEDGKITEISENIEAEDEKIDCSNKIVLPGLINCHTHVSMSLLRGVSDDKELDEWLHEEIIPRETELSPQDVYDGALLGIKEMLKSGTTCFNDMYAPEEKVAEAVDKTGIRAVLANGIIERSDIDSRLEESREFIESFRTHPRIKPVVSPHAVYTVSENSLEKLKEQAEELDTSLHIHLSETRSENEDFKAENGERPVEFLERIGLLDENVIAAHCTHLTEEEIDLLAENSVSVSHNPCANLKLGSGIAPVPELLEKEVSVGLGTDGPASNNSFNMFEEMKFASLIQKNSDPETMSAQQVLDMATVNGAEALGLDNIGSIERGNKADLVAVEVDEAVKPAEKDRIVSHLVFSTPSVSETVVDGEVLVRDGELVEKVKDF